MSKFVISVVLVLSILIAKAADFTASVDRTTVAVGETFKLTYSINTNASGFKGPSFTDFEVVSGPNQSTSMQIINGNMSQSISYSYYLRPYKEGEFSLPTASINAGGKIVNSNSIKIKVVKGSASQTQTPQSGNSQQQAASTNAGTDLFLKAIVDKATVYQGEQLIVTFKLYTKKQLNGLGADKVPVFDGFWSKEIDIPGQIALTNENVDGVNYSVGVIKKLVLFPQKNGHLEIPAFEISVNALESTKPRNWMEQFMGGNYKEVKYSLKSKPVKINVLPLPEPVPDHFSGLVGNLNLKDKLDKTSVKTNEAINLSITVSGSGNLNLIETPNITFPADFEVYDPKIKDNITTNGNGVSGSRTYEYLLIPRHPGDFEIPSVTFSYFDPVKKSYVNLQTTAYTIHVEKGEDYDGSTAVSSNIQNKEDIKYLGSDIHFIKTNTYSLKKAKEHFYRSLWFYMLLALQVMAFIAFLVFRQMQIRDNSNLLSKKSREASKMAKKHLSKAQSFLKENKKDQFYEEIFTALWGFLGDKLGIPVSQLNKEVVQERLQQRKVNEQTIKQLMDTIHSCEFARFAPGGQHQQENIYNDALMAIVKVSEEIK